MEGSLFLHLMKRHRGARKDVGNQYQPFSLPTQRSKAQTESHLSYGWLQMDNDIETLSLYHFALFWSGSTVRETPL